MRKTIKLLLLLALGFPIWNNAAGQEIVSPGEFLMPRETKIEGTKITRQHNENVDGTKKLALPAAQDNAIELKAGKTPTRNAPGRIKPKSVISDYEPIVVADGSETSYHVPFYGSYYEQKNTYSQMIYPASMLSEIKGKRIWAIRFYPTDSIRFSTASGDGKLTAYMLNTTQSTFNGRSNGYSVSGAVIDSITPHLGDKDLTFVFDGGLIYTGGNLLIDITASTAGTYYRTYFDGVSQSGAPSFYKASQTSSEYGTENFLPKMSIWYQDAIEATPSHLDYGNVSCGTRTSTQTVTIKNGNSQPVNIEWEFSGPHAEAFGTTTTGTTATLASGDTKTFSIYCEPGNTTGRLSGNFDVYVDDGTLCRVALSGNSLTEYAATITPASRDFGEVLVGETGTTKFTLTNTGAQPITIVAETDNPEFSASASATGALAAGATRDYTVTFTPSEAQSYSGSLFLTDDAHDINILGSLKGMGVTSAVPYVAEQEQVATNVPRTVCNGTDTCMNVPIRGSYVDYGAGSQMIYTSSKLSSLKQDDKIHSITFYAEEAITPNDASATDNPITLEMLEVEDSNLNSGFITSVPSGTVIASTTGSLWSNTTSVTFTFSEPYTYQGGNILLNMVSESAAGTRWKKFSWLGTEESGSDYCSYYSFYLNQGSNPTSSGSTFLPKATFEVETTDAAGNYVRTDLVDWGGQNADAFYAKEVTIYNPNSEAVTATLTTTKPFFFAQNTSSTSKTNVTLPAGVSTQTIYFNPTEAAAYTGSLTINYDNHIGSTRLTGVGLKSGEIVIRDSAFFAGLPNYTWTDDFGNSHSSNLTEIATDPNQIIALLREVYTNKSIPGNYKRGYTTSGGSEDYDNVLYSGVGKLAHTGTDYTTGFSWSNDYGWGIEGDIITGKYDLNTSSGYYDYAYYAYMNPTQYKPDQEGVTLLLVEMLDNYDAYKDDEVIVNGENGWEFNTFDSDSEKNLRYYIEHSIKSVRILTESKRTGDKSNYTSGTLFKIDADKLNKFMLLAKGQLKWIHGSYYSDYTIDTQYSYGSTPDLTFCPYPCYIYNRHINSSGYAGDVTENGFSNPLAMPAFYNMFEQFSPVSQTSESSATDLYASLVNMETFSVEHDCMTVPYRYHQFQMYGDDSEAEDCQDVRDLMFFVPDYRMMYHSDRDATNDPVYQKYTNYNPNHAPKMGLYVIKQDPVQAVTTTDDHCILELNWESNMDEFLPGEQQEYELWKLEVDEFGVEKYVPVYTRNAQGQYYNATTGTWQNDTVGAQQVVLTLDPTDAKTYSQVYEERTNSSRTVTYAIRGLDTGHFLTLQMSNEESYVIPGTDPAEMVLLSSATYYSRFNPETVKNCYSNKLQMKANPQMVKASYLASSPTMTLSRSYSVKNADNTTTVVNEPVATIQVNYSAQTMDVTLANTTILKDEYPNGQTKGTAAGYHPNTHNGTDATSWTETFTTSNGYVNFDFVIWDNFVVDVSKNEHPGQYTYELTFTTSTAIENATGDNTHAHSNEYRVPVYKTDSKISEPSTLAQVLGDTKFDDEMTPGDVEFQTLVQLSSKQNILRYDAYRWNEGVERFIVDEVGENDDEQDLPPTGIAGNQGDFYTVTMNKVNTDNYYVGDPVSVNTTNTTNWANFVDYYPTSENTDAASYVYAPVVELFTRGYKVGSTTEKRDDYNTYGGPLQSTAIGKLELEPYTPDANHPLMSDHSWIGDGVTGEAGKIYSYYNVLIKFGALDIPEGYELYKVRAWRKIDKDCLGEEMATRRGRIDNIDDDGWYLYEEINYGDPLNEAGTLTMKRENLYSADGTLQLPMIGERSSTIARPQNPDATGDPEPLFEDEQGTTAHQQAALSNEMRATFGALRLDVNGDDGSLEELNAKFRVRAYFTKSNNPLIANKSNAPAQSAPRRDGSMTGSDFDYFVAEGECEFNQVGGQGVVTGIGSVKQDLNREVVSVSYVNSIGQMSNKPWKGVNMVVTRYSDGTTTTTKVMK